METRRRSAVLPFGLKFKYFVSNPVPLNVSSAGSCAAAGLGYHVTTSGGKLTEEWNAVSNVDILGVEFGGELSTIIRFVALLHVA